MRRSIQIITSVTLIAVLTGTAASAADKRAAAAPPGTKARYAMDVGTMTGMGAKMEGGEEPRDFVWWSSSMSKEFGGGLWDWLPPATVQRLITQKVVMPPTQTSCAIPQEVKTYAPDFLMGNLYAYGPEANFSFPPKPVNAPASWTPDWTARVRYRSFTSWMIGGQMGGMGAAMGEQEAPEKKKCKPSLMGAVLGKGC